MENYEQIDICPNLLTLARIMVWARTTHARYAGSVAILERISQENPEGSLWEGRDEGDVAELLYNAAGETLLKALLDNLESEGYTVEKQ